MPSAWARILSAWRASSSAWPCSHQNRQVAQIRSRAARAGSRSISQDSAALRLPRRISSRLSQASCPAPRSSDLGRLGQGQEVGGVPVVHVVPVTALAQPVQGVLPDGLQQAEPRLVVARLPAGPGCCRPASRACPSPAGPLGPRRRRRPRRPAGRRSRRTRPAGRTAPARRADSRPKLQSSVFLRVRCRSGRSSGPAVSTPIRSSSRASSACGGSSLIRAAASSMASGRPSSLRQISATACGVSRGQLEAGRRRAGPGQRTGGPRRSPAGCRRPG